MEKGRLVGQDANNNFGVENVGVWRRKEGLKFKVVICENWVGMGKVRFIIYYFPVDTMYVIYTLFIHDNPKYALRESYPHRIHADQHNISKPSHLPSPST